MSADNIIILAPSRIKLFFKCRRLIKEYKKNDNWMNYVGKTKPQKPMVWKIQGMKRVGYLDKHGEPYWPFHGWKPEPDWKMAWGCILRFEP